MQRIFSIYEVRQRFSLNFKLQNHFYPHQPSHSTDSIHFFSVGFVLRHVQVQPLNIFCLSASKNCVEIKDDKSQNRQIGQYKWKIRNCGRNNRNVAKSMKLDGTIVFFNFFRSCCFWLTYRSRLIRRPRI